MLYLKEGVQSLAPQFSAPPALFYATKGTVAARRNAVVDPDRSGLQRFHQSERAVQASRERIGAQAVDRIVRFLNRLLFGIESRDRRDRGECFLLCAERAVRHIGEHCRFDEKAFIASPLASA